VAYDKMTGELVWKSQTGKAGYSSAMPIEIGDEKFLLIYHGVGLSLIDQVDGTEMWDIPWETDYGVNATTPIVDGDIVFFTSGYGMGSQAIRAAKENYEVLWTNPDFAAQHSDPILIDGYLYGYSGQSTSNRGRFKCIELSSGKEMWSTKEIGNGTTVFVDGYLICVDYKTSLFLIKPNPREFTLISKMDKAIEDVRYLAWTPPVVANGKLYLRYLQKLCCFDLMP
jgi:outer membrane protein assembly factor BamB